MRSSVNITTSSICHGLLMGGQRYSHTLISNIDGQKV